MLLGRRRERPRLAPIAAMKPRRRICDPPRLLKEPIAVQVILKERQLCSEATRQILVHASRMGITPCELPSGDRAAWYY
jgi:hypothetical protein